MNYRRGLLASAAALAFVAIAVLADAQVKSVSLNPTLRHPEASKAVVADVNPGEQINFAVSLQPRDLAGLQKYADGVSDPWSPLYHQFLTPEQVGQSFGPTQADIENTIGFLTRHGLAVSEVSKNGLVISASGTADQVAKAFKTKLAYASRTDENGVTSTYRTNLTPLQVPSTISASIVSIDGIDTSLRFKRRANTTQLNPTTYRAAYNASTNYAAGFYGQGVHIAIANWDGYQLNNVPYWTSTYSLPVPAGGSGSNITVVKVGSGSTTYGQGSPQGEGDLDIQSVLMSAPLANVYIYDDTTTDTAAPITTLSKISSDNLADIVTESYGWETSSSSTYYGSTWTSAHNIHLSLTAQGITYLAATGDNGTSAFPSRGVRYGYPDIDPEVLMVGGSVVNVNSSTGARVGESSWGLSGGYGGTGGYDPYDSAAHGFAFNVAPSYQTSTISSKTSAHNYRLIPDLSSSAGGQNGLGSNSGTGWALAIFYNQGAGSSYPPGTMILIDGTSIASPATAGSLGALLGAVYNGTTPNSSRSNVRFGRMQDYLYSIGTNSSVFYDITTGTSIGNLPGTSTPAKPAVGWDFATGWGSLNFGGLYSYIKSSGKAP